CGHLRYTVKLWCTNYEITHRRCRPRVRTIEYKYILFSLADNQPLIFSKLSEDCGDCRPPVVIYQSSLVTRKFW
ncbi:hypothetical protein BKA61DRAFT_473390, partial [Leptodontidium sp. MPI-SDFR-AT-0119]